MREWGHLARSESRSSTVCSSSTAYTGFAHCAGEAGVPVGGRWGTGEVPAMARLRGGTVVGGAETPRHGGDPAEYHVADPQTAPVESPW